MKGLSSTGLLVLKQLLSVWFCLWLIPSSNWWSEGRVTHPWVFSKCCLSIWVTFKLSIFGLAIILSPQNAFSLPPPLFFKPQCTSPKPTSCVISFENPFQNILEQEPVNFFCKWPENILGFVHQSLSLLLNTDNITWTLQAFLVILAFLQVNECHGYISIKYNLPKQLNYSFWHPS